VGAAPLTAVGQPIPAAGARRSIVLYDEDCGFCKWSLNRVLAWDRARRLRPVAIQSEEGSRLLRELDPAARLDSWHFVTAGGDLYSAGAAAEPLARELPGGRPLAALFHAAPRLTERAYHQVADHRDRWARLLRLDSSCAVRRG
jgi:predicted DCC family thiol-disulfide oxidoreductase YuxK